jgi:hypothetical protein
LFTKLFRLFVYANNDIGDIPAGCFVTGGYIVYHGNKRISRQGHIIKEPVEEYFEDSADLI